jgi:ADP-heptose:LPS heptosyltransferase
LGNSSYIKLVKQSTVSQVTLQELKEKLERYIAMTSKTGQQLDWDYVGAAFPYTIVEKPDSKDQWFYLKGKDEHLYKYIVLGVGSEIIPEEESNEEQYFIQVVLPEGSTHGDKAKANEFCKYLAKEYKAELHLFNGRVMYYYPRKP